MSNGSAGGPPQHVTDEAAGKPGAAMADDLDDIAALPGAQRVPLSFAQRRLWVVSHLFPESPFYNIPIAYRLRGNLDIAALENSFTQLVQRHAILRSSYHRDADGAPVQIIRPAVQSRVQVVGVPGSTRQERAANARQVARERTRVLFDLSQGTVIRAELLCLEPDDCILLIVMHHIVADHWSLGVLADELSKLYTALLNPSATHDRPGSDQAGPGLARQYADHAELQATRLEGDAYRRHLDYWRQQLADLAPPLIPGDRPRPPVPDFEGARVSLMLDRELAGQLRGYAREARVTMFAVLLAGLKVLLSRYCGTEDMAIGCAMANRADPEFEPLIGAFVDTVVLRTDLSGDPTFTELARRVQSVTLAAYDHRDLPFEKLVEVFSTNHDLSYTPFFTVAVSYLSAPTSSFLLPELEVEKFDFDPGLVRFDLDFFISEHQGAIAVGVDYRTDVYDESTIERLLSQFRHLLAAAASAPATPVSELPLQTEAEASEVARFGSNPVPRPAGRSVPELIERNAREHPHAPAVAFGDTVLTYSDLDSRAERLAHRLRRHGAGPDLLVGVALPRSAELVVTLLAVLKAGGAYLTLDPAHPSDRVAYLVSDSGATLVVAGPASDSAERFGDATVIDPAEPEQARSGERPELPAPDQRSLAYAVYTSGSTGTPKGVLLEHRNLLSLCQWHNARFGVTPCDRATMVAAQGFDASVWELWPYLVAGACVCVADEATRADPDLLDALVRDQGITIMFVPTPLAELLLTLHPDLPVRLLLTGGDTLRRRPPADAPFELVNNYGPTEAAVVATSGSVRPLTSGQNSPAITQPNPPDPDLAGPPDLGRPIENATVAVLDANLRAVPIGMVGELYIGGAGVARGYLGRPGLTADRFVPDPAGPPGARRYRTGDLVRWRADGTLTFHGRNDRQLKIRGFRIEPAEVEARLCAFPGIDEAVVVAIGDESHARLAAYLTSGSAGDLSQNQLRSWLTERLPDYLVPATFTVLPRLPVTSSGKVDYAALPEPAGDVPTRWQQPRTDGERRLEVLFNLVLERQATSIDADFFDLGGHSVLAVMLASRIQREFGVRLPVRTVFTAPTIERLAAEIVAVRPAPDPGEVNRRLLERLAALPAGQAQALVRSFGDCAARPS